MAGRENYPWYRKAHRSWYVNFQGKQVHLGADKEAAWHKWHRLEAGLEQPPASSPPLSALIDAYLADAEKRLKANTLEVKRHYLNRLKTDKGEVPAEQFAADAILDWFRSTGWGQSTQHLVVSIVKTMMLWAVKRGTLAENPVAGVQVKPPVSRGAESIVTPEVHARLMAVSSPAHQALLTALWETGCRPSEVFHVEARHFDAVAGCWRLDVHKTDKSGRVRVVYLSPVMVELCKRLVEKNPSGRLFRNMRGKPFTLDAFDSWLWKLRRRLGLGKVIAYGFRHTFATTALANGVPDAAVAELLGHSGTNMLHKHYAHLGARADALRSALGKVR